nr:acetyl-CoA carboxylase biotin carboxyl carrier protein [Caldalkalibacillus salinus]
MHEIRELIKLVDQSSINDFEYEFEGLKVMIKKNEQGTTAVHTPSEAVTRQEAVSTEPETRAPEAPVAPEPQREKAAPAPSDVADDQNLHQITSPMVGTFYSAPSPDADPYVKSGDKVQDATVVCIVEAMKLMNEIEAEVRGEIVEVLVENGQLVEYGQPLFLVRPE